MGLRANVPRVQAQRALAEGRWRTAEDLYDLTYLATDSRDAAEQAFKARRWQELKDNSVAE